VVWAVIANVHYINKRSSCVTVLSDGVVDCMFFTYRETGQSKFHVEAYASHEFQHQEIGGLNPETESCPKSFTLQNLL